MPQAATDIAYPDFLFSFGCASHALAMAAMALLLPMVELPTVSIY
jgi:hypothetical protein